MNEGRKYATYHRFKLFFPFSISELGTQILNEVMIATERTVIRFLSWGPLVPPRTFSRQQPDSHMVFSNLQRITIENRTSKINQIQICFYKSILLSSYHHLSAYPFSLFKSDAFKKAARVID